MKHPSVGYSKILINCLFRQTLSWTRCLFEQRRSGLRSALGSLLRWKVCALSIFILDPWFKTGGIINQEWQLLAPLVRQEAGVFRRSILTSFLQINTILNLSYNTYKTSHTTTDLVCKISPVFLDLLDNGPRLSGLRNLPLLHWLERLRAPPTEL